MSFEIRPLSEDEVPLAAEIEKTCFSCPWSEVTLASEMKNQLNDFYGAFDENGVPAGYAGMQTVFDETSILNVAVLPKFRRHGAGRALVEALVARARERGAKTVYLEVRTSNLPAIGLYESLGFVFFGVRKGYYKSPTENALLLRLILEGEAETEDPIDCWDE